MTEERASEIIRSVIYAPLQSMPIDTIDSASAFHVGRMIGRMQKQLEFELNKEVEASKTRVYSEVKEA